MAERYSGYSRHGADFQTIRAELLESGEFFEDPDFPPSPRSLYSDGRNPKKSGQVVWKRAKDIFRKPLFISEGAQRHDLDQGRLGNCWFVAAAATLTVGEKSRFEKVVPPDQDFGRNYAGIFHFNFWWYGQWKEVIVDDYLPTDGQRLIYCHNREQPNEFWPALLEKAYAKLRGCYEALDGGHAQDALVDMTGGVSEVIDISNKANIPANLYKLLYASNAMDSLQVASISKSSEANTREQRRSNGLVEGHAYSVTKFYEVTLAQGTVHLLRLRNPWGYKEWDGPWSDGSEEIRRLPHSIREEMRVQEKDEGEFWMSYRDFVQNFDQIHLCHLQVDSMTEELRYNTTKQKWHVAMHHGEWISNVTAGGCANNWDGFFTNPQFFVELTESDTLNSRDGGCTLIVSLMKQRPSKSEPVSIGFKIYQLRTPDRRPLNQQRYSRNVLSSKDSGKFMFHREVTRRFELPPGHYVIIPSTFNADDEAKFILRLFTEKIAFSSAMR